MKPTSAPVASPERRLYDAIKAHEDHHHYPPTAAEVTAKTDEDEQPVTERLDALDADPLVPVQKLPRKTGDVDRYPAVQTSTGIEEEL
jgi:hypothetical protein